MVVNRFLPLAAGFVALVLLANWLASRFIVHVPLTPYVAPAGVFCHDASGTSHTPSGSLVSAGSPAPGVPWMMRALTVTASLAVVFCVFRGLPVIIRSLKNYWGVPSAARPQEG